MQTMDRFPLEKGSTVSRMFRETLIDEIASSSSAVGCLPCYPPPHRLLHRHRHHCISLARPPPSPLPLRSLPPLPSSPSSHNTLLTVFFASSALGFLLHTLASPDSALASSSSLHTPLDSDLRALALGPQGPLLEEFWDNMRRYGFYFLTVLSGGIYSLLEPLLSLLKNPLTAVLTVLVISGSIYLLYLTLNTMLGINAFDYNYS